MPQGTLDGRRPHGRRRRPLAATAAGLALAALDLSAARRLDSPGRQLLEAGAAMLVAVTLGLAAVGAWRALAGWRATRPVREQIEDQLPTDGRVARLSRLAAALVVSGLCLLIVFHVWERLDRFGFAGVGTVYTIV